MAQRSISPCQGRSLDFTQSSLYLHGPAIAQGHVGRMIEETGTSPNQSRLPQNLSAWVERKVLVRLVLDAVQAACDPADEQGSWKTQVPVGRPRILLTLLVYSYASGIYASEQIEDRVTSDPGLRYLSAGARPTWHDLRRFRRQQRPLIQAALAKAIQSVWKLGRWPMPPATEPRSGSWDASAASSLADVSLATRFTLAAKDRIEQAIHWDSMVLDE